MTEAKKRLVSGVKPTGRPHIGNYFGAMKQFVDLQDEYDAYYMVADYHGLNFIQNGDEMRGLIKVGEGLYWDRTRYIKDHTL
jgi:tryptophanyl-tRNA synthetase